MDSDALPVTHLNPHWFSQVCKICVNSCKWLQFLSVWGRGLLPPAAGDTVTVGQILKQTHSKEAEPSAAAQVNSRRTHLGEEAAQMMKINDSLPVWLRGRLIHSPPPHLANRATDFPLTR